MKVRKYIEKIWPPFMTKEDRYYYHLFVKNKKWNSANPNTDEKFRWNAIEGFLKYVLQQLPPAPNILDVGSGRGWMTNLLAGYGKAEGLEQVASVVKYAARLFPLIVFHQGSVEHFMTKGLRYDIIVCTEVIEHVPDSEKPGFIGALHKLLKEGGFLIITTPRKEILDSIPLQPGQPVEDWLSENDVSRFFTENSFKTIDKKVIKMEYFEENREVYQAWLFQRLN